MTDLAYEVTEAMLYTDRQTVDYFSALMIAHQPDIRRAIYDAARERGIA